MSNFSQNFTYLTRRFKNQSEIEKDLNIHRSTISKLKSGYLQPTAAHKAKIAKRFAIAESELDLAPKAFLQIYGKSDLVFLQLRTAGKTLLAAEKVAQELNGQYGLYYLQDDGKRVVASLLTITGLSKEGIEVNLINPHESGTTVTHYDYAGYLYRVRDLLYFFMEQKQADNDILTLTAHYPNTPEPHLLRGIMTGEGVLRGKPCIGATAFIMRRRRSVADWKKLQGTEIGYLDQRRIPMDVRDELKMLPRDVRV